MAFDERLAERVRGELGSREPVVEKKMFGGLAFMVKNRMACGIMKSSLMVRVDPEDAGAFLREPGARPMDFTRRPMPGFLYVDPPGFATKKSLSKWVARAVAYAESQPPKPPKRVVRGGAQPRRRDARRD